MNKKHLFFTFLLALIGLSEVFSQVGIGTKTPAAGAILDLTATNKALLITRVANTAEVTSPVNGMIIYDISSRCVKAYQNEAWSACFITPPAVVSAYVCNTASAGTMTVGTPVSGVTQTITATVTAVGPYSITTTANGVTFSGAGTFASTGAQAIVLTATGTPTAAGTFSYALSTTPGCSFNRVVSCGAFVAAGVFKAFACHNLGADQNLDPNIPVQGIHGNYYQWGRNAPAGTPTALIGAWGSQGGTSANGNWTSTGTGGPNDPCPAGFRVPSKTEWDGVKNASFNTVSITGSWADDGNFTTAIHYGPSVSIKTLTLPAAGFRDLTDGTLFARGALGIYWSSSESSTNAWCFDFDSTNSYTDNDFRTNGFSVRCVSE